jgi:hypothetical protein
MVRDYTFLVEDGKTRFGLRADHIEAYTAEDALAMYRTQHHCRPESERTPRFIVCGKVTVDEYARARGWTTE